MTNIVYKKIYPAPPIDKREILRYAGVRGEATDIMPLFDECLNDVRDSFSYKVCYSVVAVDKINQLFKIGASELYARLHGCSHVLVFAATVGVAIDRLIARMQCISEARALILQAIGTERVESVCDAFESEIAERALAHGVAAISRFSPGYGNLPLGMQRDVFSMLSPTRHIGVSLCDNLLMTPSKSVTAFIGLTGNIGD